MLAGADHAALLLLGIGLIHGIEGAARLEPRYLGLIEGLVDGEVVGGAVGSLALQGEGLAGCKCRQAFDADPVERAHLHAHMRDASCAQLISLAADQAA